MQENLVKMVFHVPVYRIGEDGKMSGLDYLPFRQALLAEMEKLGIEFLRLGVVKACRKGRMMDEETLTVYCEEDTATGAAEAFVRLVSRMHGELGQELYYYERGDILVSVGIGEKEGGTCR